MALMHDLAREHDRNELRTGEGLDVKAGILLALTAVLIAINGPLLGDYELSDALKITQLAALLLAAIAALCACVVIMYRFYARPETPESFEAWQARLESHGLNDAATDFANKEMRAAFDRIDKNHGVNAVRYGWLIFGFLAAMLSLIADIVTLGIHAIEKLHS